MINLAVPNLTGNERNYLNQCIDSTFVSSVGEFVNRIESMVAKLSDAKYGVATSSGTTALHTALMTVGVKPGDIVIVPSFTFIASANAIAHCGAIPWFFDIDPVSWTIDSMQVLEELKEKTFLSDGKVIHLSSGRTVSAIMPVYTLGNIPDMDAMCELAKEYNLPLVADAACAIGAEYKKQKMGSFADLTCYSFNGNKTFTAGGGGAIVGNDESLLMRAKHISTTARVNAEYDFDMVGYNYRMTNIQAAVGCAQLERFDEFIKIKRHVRAFYNEAFADDKYYTTFSTPDYCDSVCWFSGIILEEGGLDRIRVICSKLKEKGIEARSFWKPVHLQDPYAGAEKCDSLINTENIWDRIITLPCSTNITDQQLLFIVESVKSIFE